MLCKAVWHPGSPWPKGWTMSCHAAGSPPWSGRHISVLPELTFWCVHPKLGGAGGKWQFGKAYGLPQTLMLHPGLCFCRIRPFPSCLSCQDVCPALTGSPAGDMFLSCSLINIFTPGRVLAWPAITRSILTLLAAKMLLSPA